MKSLIYITILSMTSISLAMCNNGNSNKALLGIEQLPKFQLTSPDSSRIISSEAIQEGKLSVFFYFDPECEHCQKETEGIIANQAKFKNVNFYFLSNSSAKEIYSFSNYYSLDKFQNVFVGKDYGYSFYNVFLPPTIPYMAIYNSDKKLSKIYNGAMDISSLIKNTRN